MHSGRPSEVFHTAPTIESRTSSEEMADIVGTPPITDHRGVVPGSIASLEEVSLGTRQWVLVRGRSLNAPLLLYLAGGPGFSELARLRHFNRDLEDQFIVVNWDQRGSGKSYRPEEITPDLDIEDYISDSLRLIQYLRDRFGRESIFLMGHSWGSILGVELVRHHPHLFKAYAGIGQVVNMIEGDHIAYQWLWERAIETGGMDALTQMLRIGLPPYTQEEGWKYRLLTECLERFGAYGTDRFIRESQEVIRNATEYTREERGRIFRGMWNTFAAVYPKLTWLDLVKQAPRLEIPVHFFHGTLDYATPLVLAERYYGTLDAPSKGMVVFEGAGHSPHFERAKEFIPYLLERFLGDGS